MQFDTDVDKFEEFAKEQENMYKYVSPIIFLFIRIGFVLMLVCVLAKKVKTRRDVAFFFLFFLIAYVIEQVIFVSTHLILHAEFGRLNEAGKTNLAHYHHYIDASIYERFPQYHRGSYFNIIYTVPFFIIFIFFTRKNPVILWSTLFLLTYDITIHEGYHVRDKDTFYKTESLGDLLFKPNVVDRFSYDVGHYLGIHDRERHRTHHLTEFERTKTGGGATDDWDDMFLFGKPESYLKNKYANSMYNSIEHNDHVLLLTQIHFVVVFILIILFVSRSKVAQFCNLSTVKCPEPDPATKT